MAMTCFVGFSWGGGGGNYPAQYQPTIPLPHSPRHWRLDLIPTVSLLQGLPTP